MVLIEPGEKGWERDKGHAHKSCMYWFQPSLKSWGKRTILPDNDHQRAKHVPRSHEREHDERVTHRRIVLIASLGSIPLRQAENFHEKDAEEHEQHEPEREQTEDGRQTRADNRKKKIK
jgi:hypothetical protein